MGPSTSIGLADRATLPLAWGLLAGLLLLALGGCQRLNPAWCEAADRCAPDEYCDPRSNTCQPRELGLTDSRPDQLPADGPADGPAADGAKDSAGELDQLSDGNPDSPASCSGELWVCQQGVVIQRCTEVGLVEQRICPDGLCDNGHCQPPPGAPECQSSRDCTTNQLCTLFLGTGATLLRRCAAPVSGFVGAGSCSSGLDCATGLCTSDSRCYYACTSDPDCPTGLTCEAVELLIEGQLSSTTSCTPP